MRAASLIATIIIALGASGLTASGGGSTVPSSASVDDRDPDAGTVVVEVAMPSQRQAVASDFVDAMPVAEQATAVLMGHVPTVAPDIASSYIRETGIAGFIVMGSNVSDPDQLRALTAQLASAEDLPPLVAVDQEGGDVRRLRWDEYPAADVLKTQDPSATATAFRARGALVERAGITLNFGIVADWASDPGSFIFSRALGTDPQSAATRVASAVEGERPFVASTLKHFPGHGAAPGDSHVSIPQSGMSFDTWSTTEAEPFREGIAAGAEFVMFGHLAYTAVDPVPASLSARWHEILREDLGFDGVAVTDDMAMLEATGNPAWSDPVGNAVSALAAGNDLILGVSYTDHETVVRVAEGIQRAVEQGELSHDRLVEAATRTTAARMSQGSSVGVAALCAECMSVD